MTVLAASRGGRKLWVGPSVSVRVGRRGLAVSPAGELPRIPGASVGDSGALGRPDRRSVLAAPARLRSDQASRSPSQPVMESANEFRVCLLLHSFTTSCR